MGTIDQRRAIRYEVAVAAEVYTDTGVLQAQTRNLSDSGVCLDIPAPLDEGGTVGVSLFTTSDGIEDPDREPLNVKASVIWCTERDEEGYSVGARFVDVNGENEAALKQFLSALGVPA